MKRHLFLTITLVMFFLLAANAFAATYYVKSNGNDKLNGRSDATAWKTIGKVNRYSFATGDNVYFKCGNSWTEERLVVDWSGTSGNHVVIGAYYLSAGNEVHGVSGNKPIIDGNDTIPTLSYTALVDTKKQNYIDIYNLRVINSEGYGFLFQDSNNCNGYGLEIDNVYRTSIMINNCNVSSGSSVFEGCVITRHSMRTVGGGTWSGGLVCIGANNVTIRKNIVCEGYGEGIYIGNLWGGQTGGHCIIEDNIAYDNRSAQIYLHNTGNNIVRRNLVYGSGNTTYSTRSNVHFDNPKPYFAGSGIYMTDEDWESGTQCKNNKVYNNLVSYCYSGIHIGNSLFGASFEGSVIYNNTVVDCFYGLKITGTKFSNSAIKNNIFWNVTQESSKYDSSANYNGRTTTPGLTWSHNNWSSKVSGDLSGTGDIIGAPLLSKTTGWRSVTGGDLNGSDFALQPNSPAKDAGTPLGAKFDDTPDCDKSVWPTRIVLMDQNNQGSGWEIGADIYVANPTVLDPPTGLKIEAGR